MAWLCNAHKPGLKSKPRPRLLRPSGSSKGRSGCLSEAERCPVTLLLALYCFT